ncbi:MAG: hypothetical protein R3F19_34775 [Verrucomicrobiales bacterium]
MIRKYFACVVLTLIVCAQIAEAQRVQQVQRKLSGPILANGGQVAGYQISPDGKSIAFIADFESDNAFHLYRMPVDGGEPVRLTDRALAPASFYYSLPTVSFRKLWWAPDGSSIYFPSGNGVSRIPADGSGLASAVYLEQDRYRSYVDGFQSPDGTLIIQMGYLVGVGNLVPCSGPIAIDLVASSLLAVDLSSGFPVQEFSTSQVGWITGVDFTHDGQWMRVRDRFNTYYARPGNPTTLLLSSDPAAAEGAESFGESVWGQLTADGNYYVSTIESGDHAGVYIAPTSNLGDQRQVGSRPLIKDSGLESPSLVLSDDGKWIAFKQLAADGLSHEWMLGAVDGTVEPTVIDTAHAVHPANEDAYSAFRMAQFTSGSDYFYYTKSGAGQWLGVVPTGSGSMVPIEIARAATIESVSFREGHFYFIHGSGGQGYISELDPGIRRSRLSLSRVPVTGGAMQSIVEPRARTADVEEFHLSPDERWAVFRSDHQSAGQPDIYAVRTTGGEPVLLSHSANSGMGLEIAVAGDQGVVYWSSNALWYADFEAGRPPQLLRADLQYATEVQLSDDGKFVLVGNPGLVIPVDAPSDASALLLGAPASYKALGAFVIRTGFDALAAFPFADPTRELAGEFARGVTASAIDQESRSIVYAQGHLVFVYDPEAGSTRLIGVAPAGTVIRSLEIAGDMVIFGDGATLLMMTSLSSGGGKAIGIGFDEEELLHDMILSSDGKFAVIAKSRSSSIQDPCIEFPPLTTLFLVSAASPATPVVLSSPSVAQPVTKVVFAEMNGNRFLVLQAGEIYAIPISENGQPGAIVGVDGLNRLADELDDWDIRGDSGFIVGRIKGAPLINLPILRSPAPASDYLVAARLSDHFDTNIARYQQRELTDPTDHLIPVYSSEYVISKDGHRVFWLGNVQTRHSFELFSAHLDPQGGYDRWALDQFAQVNQDLQLLQQDIYERPADPDGDGMVNGIEYLLGTDPQSSGPDPFLIEWNDNESIVYRFAVPIENAGRLQIIAQSSTDMINWRDGESSWEQTAVNAADGFARVAVTVGHPGDEPGSAHYFRLVIRELE